MNILTNPTDDVVGLVTNLYNSNCTNTPAAPQAPNANPFMNPSMGSNTMNSGGSIFSGGNTAPPSSNLFGSSSSAASSNPFARNAAGFGGPQNQMQNQNANLFGGSAAATPNSMNLFGAGTGGNNATTGNSLFGGSSFSNTGSTPAFGSATQSNSLFGGGGGSTSGPFSQQTTNASPFALPQSTNQSTGLFGAQAQSNPVFGAGASFGSQKTGLFGQASASLGSNAPANTGNIFGQSVQAPAYGGQQQQTNLFGNANQNQTQSLFAGQQQQQQQPQSMQAPDNPFAAVAQSATTNIFGQSQMQQQPQPQPQSLPFQSSGSVFGSNQNTNTFGGNANIGQSLFTAAQQNPLMNNQPIQAQGQPQTLQQQQQSIFGASSFSAQPTAPVQSQLGGGNVFQSVQEQQQQPSTQSLFSGQAQQQQNIFGAAVTPVQQPAQQSKTIYTPMDSLSQEELEAFNSNAFDISKIPTNPPPMELCT